ncbi:MAG: hypothetical protein FJ083_10685 [Cyanobacteria bacterium K_Offshore_surface_m2_239]|nr:hypothetical protein [Cyanobacteria bacterium K_Offshore_surface_m2_239]
MAASGSVLNTFLCMPILFLEDDRPLRLYNYSRARDELKHINDQLITDAEIIAESSKNSSTNFDHSWTYANILVALGPALVNNNLKNNDHGYYFRKWIKAGRHCWTDYGKTNGPCHLGPTAWVLMAMSMNSIKPSAEMWRYVLDQQDRLGWWSLYENSGSNSQNASAYSTAVALWALHTGLETNMIPDELIDRSKVSVGRARNWLYSKLDRVERSSDRRQKSDQPHRDHMSKCAYKTADCHHRTICNRREYTP